MTHQLHGAALFREWLETSDHTQSDVAEILEVSRAAVSKWAKEIMVPSRHHAKELEKLSGGAVPATSWPRRELPTPANRGQRALQTAAKKRGSVLGLAEDTGLPHRALARWTYGQSIPRKNGIAAINQALSLNLKQADFEVRA